MYQLTNQNVALKLIANQKCVFRSIVMQVLIGFLYLSAGHFSCMSRFTILTVVDTRIHSTEYSVKSLATVLPAWV